jgi:hypothetical protein
VNCKAVGVKDSTLMLIISRRSAAICVMVGIIRFS